MLGMNGKALTQKCLLCGGSPTNQFVRVVSLEPSPLSWEVGSISPSPPMSSIGEMRKLVPKSQSKAVMESGFKFRPGSPEPGLADSGSSPLSQIPWMAYLSFPSSPAQVVPGHETHPEGKEEQSSPDPGSPLPPQANKAQGLSSKWGLSQSARPVSWRSDEEQTNQSPRN